MAGRRGRPVGFRLSEESKRAISESKMGQRHKQSTKDKISRSLIVYFRKKNPLSDEVINRYCSGDNYEACTWVNSVLGELDEIDDVLTEKSLRNTLRTEIPCGKNIEAFSHNITPELLLLFKELCERIELDPMEVYDSLGGE